MQSPPRTPTQRYKQPCDIPSTRNGSARAPAEPRRLYGDVA